MTTAAPTTPDAPPPATTSLFPHTAAAWPLLDKYFQSPNARYRLTQHHLQSYSDFVRYKIPTVLQDFNSWQHSEVFRGRDFARADAVDKAAGTEHDAQMNAAARAHFFVGMHPLDVHAMSRDGADLSHPDHRPKRVQVRHQVLEYAQEADTPRRWVTPNEARLRNLNYQLDVTVDVVVVQDSALDDAHNAQSRDAYVRGAMDAWHRHYAAVDATLKGGGGGGEPTLAARAAKVKGPTQGRAAGKGAGARTAVTADDWAHVVQQAVATAEGRYSDAADARRYVAQRLATALAPNVTWEEGIGLTKLPLMLHSDFCVLRDQPDAFLREVGECTYEKGGYFVIRGKEKVIISQEDYQRNIIQTRAIKREAPPSFVPASTLVLQRGSGNGVGDKKAAGDTLGQEEDFEASIRCDDDPRPPVVVKLTLKRQAAYYGSAGGGGGADPADHPFDFKGPQLGRMRQFLPFKGLYVTLDSRKGPENPILVDIPLFAFFRAMGPTSGSGALNAAAAGHHQREQLSDREILEAILGYDLSSTERASVAADAVRASLGVDATPKPGETVWYHPQADADTFWCTCTGKDAPTELATGTRVTVLLPGRRRTVVMARAKGGQRAGGDGGQGSRTLTTTTPKTVCEAVVLRAAGRGHYQLRLASTESAARAPDPTDAPQPSKLTVGGRAHPCVVCPHRYARRHRATVLRATKAALTVEYTTHTARDRAHDPLLYDLLRPSVLEGSFAPTVAVARDMLDRSFTSGKGKTHETLKMQDEELQGIGPRATATDRREAVFRTLFTHIKPDTSIQNLRERRRALLRRKQLYLGYMVRRLLFAYMGMDERETSRDSYRMRRVKLSGEMLAEVFRYEYFQLQNKYKEYIKQGMRQQGPQGTFDNLLLRSVLTTNLFDSMYMTDRLQKSFMGNWGGKIAENAEDQKAYCQELIRLSFLGSIAYLRRVHKELPSTSKPGQKKGTSKAVGPRLLHASQYGMICPLETPDGGNIGKIKHLTMFAFVCPEMPHADREAVRAFVAAHALPVERVARFADLVHYHKVLLDGAWTHVVPVAGYTARLEAGDGGDGSDAATTAAALPPDAFVEALRLHRRNGLLTPLLSVAWDIKRQEIVLSTQEGRVMRPLLIVEGANALALSRAHHLGPAVTWEALLVGPAKGEAPATYHELTYRHTLATKLSPNLRTASFADQCQALRATAGVIEYLDTAEIDTRMVAMQPQQLTNREWLMKTMFRHKGLVAHLETAGALVYADAAHPSPDTARLLTTAPLQAWVRAQRKAPSAQAKAQRDAVPYARRLEYDLAVACNVPYEPPLDADQQPLAGRGTRTTFTHAELHPALMLGTMGMLIPYPEHSQAPRNQYSCHQSKQGLGTYVSNFRKRMDHANHVLHYPQRSLASSRFLHYINRERLNYGTNVLVAIMCYGGYNIEDAILFNKQSVARGLFHSSYYFTEEVTEKGGTSGSARESVVIGRHPDVPRAATGYQYDKLDTDAQQRGVLPDTFVDKPVAENDVLIEAYEEKREGADQRSFTDYRRVASKAAVVDQVFLSDGQVGRRVGKVTLRTVRVPTIGDKFASRCGQKGTLGALVDEEDMPFVGEGPDSAFLAGARPDLILNPHAIPSRMTVGQLMESLSNVLGCKLGCFTDSTPLCSTQTMGATSNPAEKVSTILGALGLHQHGNVRMCNGTTGERLHGEVFFGPTYYQRLKQMPVDKYYWRREGRADMFTKQPIGGRAQGGALKLGEMERDSLLAHGISSFTKEAFFEKSDHFQYRVSTARGTVDPPEVEGKVDPSEYVPVRTSMAALHEDGGFRQYLSTQTEDPTDYKAHADICDPRERRRTNVETATVNVPFATRLFSQECEAMGVGMRLVPGGEVRVRR